MWVVWFQTIPILKGPPSMMLPVYLLLVRLFIASDRRNTLGVPAVPGALSSSFTRVILHSSPMGIVTPPLTLQEEMRQTAQEGQSLNLKPRPNLGLGF